MAKRDTGVGTKRQKLKSPHKTVKRLQAKRERLTALKLKRGK